MMERNKGGGKPARAPQIIGQNCFWRIITRMIEGTGYTPRLSPLRREENEISLTKGQRNPRNKRKQKGRCTLRFGASDGLESDRDPTRERSRAILRI